MADHGISSQSRQTQVVSSFAQRSAAVSAARTRSRNCRSRSVVVEEPPAGAGVDDAGLAGGHAEPLPRRRLVPADDDDGPRAHVLLFADDLRDALVAVVGERLGRMLQQPGSTRLVSHGDIVGGR